VRGVEPLSKGCGGSRAAGGEVAAEVERAFFGRGIPRGNGGILHDLDD
jgi:hypothetical protein